MTQGLATGHITEEPSADPGAPLMAGRMRVVLLCNARAGTKSGGSSDPDGLVRALAEAGVDARCLPTDGGDLADAARRAARESPDAIIVAGGDGSVSAVAGALAGSGVPMGVLPCGTLNHFAKDLGLPLSVEAAAQVIAAGNVRAVDVAEVNGQVFVNNASIGVYPHIVSKRNRQQERLGRGKWLAMLVAIGSIFRRYPLVEVVLDAGDRAMRRLTPLVFIGNNRYAIELLKLGARERLDAGELCLYFANRTGRFGLVHLALRTLFGRLRQVTDFESLCRPEVTIETRKKTLRIALDGEVTRLTPPLVFRSRPGALRVIAP